MADLLAFETLTLEWLHHYGQQRISPQCLNDAEFVTHLDHATDSLILEMKAHVLAKRCEPEVEEVPFAKSMKLERYASWWQSWKPEWVARVWPRKTVESTVMVEGNVKVTKTAYDTFPDSTIKYPKDLGRPVVIPLYSAEDYRGYAA